MMLENIAFKIVLTFFLAMALINSSSAFNYGVAVRNAYSFEPIEGAAASFYFLNGTLADAEVSDSGGLLSFTPPDFVMYSVVIEKTGFNDYSYYEVINESAPDKIAYMTYSSVEISRFRLSDKSIAGITPLCFYYIDGGRLKGCYDANDTIILSAGNYSVYPHESSTSYLTSLSGITTLLILLIPAFLAIGVVLILGFALIMRLRRW